MGTINVTLNIRDSDDNVVDTTNDDVRESDAICIIDEAVQVIETMRLIRDGEMHAHQFRLALDRLQEGLVNSGLIPKDTASPVPPITAIHVH